MHRFRTCAASVVAAFAFAAGTSEVLAASADAGLGADLSQAAPAVDPKVLGLATHALGCARTSGEAAAARTLSVIDYSRPSTQPRLWVFDLQRKTLLFEEWVAHGRNTGENYATQFSNANGSLKSSLGGYVTADPYIGHNGYSLRLRGLDAGFNDHADARAIVIHGAPYVSADLIRREGRLGRSFGCPAVRPQIARQLIDAIRGGSFVFAYYPDHDWLAHSPLLGDCAATRTAAAPAATDRDAVAAVPSSARVAARR